MNINITDKSFDEAINCVDRAKDICDSGKKEVKDILHTLCGKGGRPLELKLGGIYTTTGSHGRDFYILGITEKFKYAFFNFQGSTNCISLSKKELQKQLIPYYYLVYDNIAEYIKKEIK